MIVHGTSRLKAEERPSGDRGKLHRKIVVRVIASLLMFVGPTLASRVALAEKFDCESVGGLSPHPATLSAIHDHDRYAPRITGIAKEFAAIMFMYPTR